MGIFMFITFASANLITIGAMWYGFMSQYRYNNGMVLGVHIPPEHAEEPGVTEQVADARRKMKRFHIINLILIISTFLNFLFKKLHHQRYSFLSIYNTFSTDTFALTAFFQNYIYIHICSRAPLSSYFWYTLIAITNPLVEYRLPNVSLHHQRLKMPHNNLRR